jgi:regulator of sigma E protease
MPELLTGIGNDILDVVILLAILVVLVVIHEFGHFIVARRAGVTVHEFGIGFPPRALTFARDKKGTIYTLNWLPIGGFVRMEGEEGDSDDPHSFVRQKLPTRLTILLAGVTMNLLLAITLMSIIAGAADPSAAVRVKNVLPGSPAEAAGLQGGRPIGTITLPDGQQIPNFDDSGDLILALDGRKYAWFDPATGPTAITDYARAHPDTDVRLTVQRANGEVEDIVVHTRSKAEIDAGAGALGIQQQTEQGPVIPHDALAAIAIGVQRTGDAATLIVRALGDFMANLTNPPVAGPVGMVSIVSTVRTQAPPVTWLYLIALLSANLAVVNVLPLPPLDGGRVAVSLLQAALGNRVSATFERYVYLAGFVFLMAMLAWVTLFDTGILQRSTGT